MTRVLVQREKAPTDDDDDDDNDDDDDRVSIQEFLLYLSCLIILCASAYMQGTIDPSKLAQSVSVAPVNQCSTSPVC